MEVTLLFCLLMAEMQNVGEQGFSPLHTSRISTEQEQFLAMIKRENRLEQEVSTLRKQVAELEKERNSLFLENDLFRAKYHAWQDKIEQIHSFIRQTEQANLEKKCPFLQELAAASRSLN